MFDGMVSDAFKVAAPKILHHYTSWAGAEGILRSQTFWATAHDCTNDEAELKSADGIIMEVAREVRRSTRGAASTVLDLFLVRRIPNAADHTPADCDCWTSADMSG
jgi:hypothetical protein